MGAPPKDNIQQVAAGVWRCCLPAMLGLDRGRPGGQAPERRHVERLNPSGRVFRVAPGLRGLVRGLRVSERHAQAIVSCIRKLLAEIREDAHDAVEQLLVAEAEQSDPLAVIRLGRQVGPVKISV